MIQALATARPVLVAAILLIPAGGVWAAETKYPIGQNVGFRYYGQLHFANQSVDDGVTSTSNLVDISNADTRFGFFIEPLDGASPLSFQFETSLGFRSSDKTSQTNTPDAWNWGRKELRQVQLILSTGFGTFRLGQGSMPTDGVAEADLGGTVIVAKSTIPESHGGFEFQTTAGALSGITIRNTFNNYDGPRLLRLRYDTNSYAGFSFSAAYGQEVLTSGIDDEYLDIAMRYENSKGDFDIKGAIGISYVNAASFAHASSVGSIAVRHRPSGLNLSLASGHAGSGGRESYVYLKGGWSGKLLSVGETKLVFESFFGDDYNTSQSYSTMLGAAFIQEFDAQNLEIYAGYRGFSYEEPTAITYQNIDAIQIGARWQF
jgi:hypothetical protein